MKEKLTIKKVLIFVILLALGAIFGYFLGKMLASGNALKVDFSPLAATMLIVPIFLFVVAWHEAGHALAGVAQGFDFKMYVVGPFLWEKQQEKWRFKWNTDLNKSGGLVVCLPKTNKDLIPKFSFFVMAGPVASLLLSLFCLLIFWLLPKRAEGVSLFDFFLVASAAISLLIFVSTIIPSQMGGFYSDGARFLRLRKGGDVSKFEVLILSIISSATSGIRPKLLDISMLEQAQSLATKLNEPFGIYIQGYFYQRAFDNGDIDQAEKHLLEYINQAPNISEGLRNGVWLDAAFFYACAKKDITKANYYWAMFKPSAIMPKAYILATEASRYYLQNEKEKVIAYINLALAQLPNMMDRGFAIVLHEKLLLLKNETENL